MIYLEPKINNSYNQLQLFTLTRIHYNEIQILVALSALLEQISHPNNKISMDEKPSMKEILTVIKLKDQS